MTVQITIAIYFSVIIGIGIYSAFRVKNPTDYYVAGKRAGKFAVAGSLLATILGGSAILGTIEWSQKIGWAALWFLLSAAFGLFALLFISKRVRRYGNFTLPELLGRFYGASAEKAASLVIPAAWLGIIAAQIIAAAKILSGLGGISYFDAALLSGVVFIIYTLLGGQLSIIKTDTLQAVLIIIGLVALIVFAQTSHASVKNNFEVIKLFNEDFTPLDLLILLLTYSVTFVVGPDIYSRLFCAKDEKNAQSSVLLVAIVLVPISFGLTYLGVFSSETNQAGIISFASDLLPAWAYGLFLAALLSAVMSSADTTLLTSSLILNEIFTTSLDTRKSMRNTRILIVVSGALSILISLYVTSIVQSLLFALTIFSGAFVIPTLAGLLGVKVNSRYVLWAILTGGTIALAGKIVQNNFNDLLGNGIIISAHLFNLLILLRGKGRCQKFVSTPS